MRGNNFKEKKVVPLIFMQFWNRSHLNQLDRLTPQDWDAYYIEFFLKFSLPAISVDLDTWYAPVKCRTVGQIPKKCKETSDLMWLSYWYGLFKFFFVCRNLFCTLANLRIKCVIETKNVSLLFYRNLKSSFFTWLTGFFTFLVGLTHGVPCSPLGK
jgi:hypothetical protein